MAEPSLSIILVCAQESIHRTQQIPSSSPTGNHSQRGKLQSFSLEKALGKKAKINFLPLQPGDVQDTYANVDNLKEKFDAVKFVKVGSEIIGGQGGGGRKDFAQAGGQDQSKIDQAFEKLKTLI